MSLGQFLRDKIVAGLASAPAASTVVVGSVLFSTVIPLSGGGKSFMAQKTVNGPLAFSVSPLPVQSSEAYLRLVADGVNVPTFPGMLAQSGSSFDNRKGIINTIRFFYDGYDTWYYITQAIGATPPDITAPTLSNASPTVVTDVAATVTLTTTEGEGTLFYMVSTNVTESAATVKAGAQKAVTAAGTVTLNFAGLTSSTRYYGHFLHRDLSGNESAVLNGSGFWTQAPPDTVAPKLTLPTGTQTGQTTATGTVTTDEANGTLFRYVSTNPTESAATIKAANLTQAVTASGVQNVSFTGLTANTTYYPHYLHRDTAGNESFVVDGASFTTQAAQTIGVNTPATTTAYRAYTLSGTWTGIQPTSLEYRITDNAGTPGAWTALSGATINANGTWSVSMTPTSGSASRVMSVRDASTQIAGASAAYTVLTMAQAYRLTNTNAASMVASTTNANLSSPDYYGNPTSTVRVNVRDAGGVAMTLPGDAKLMFVLYSDSAPNAAYSGVVSAGANGCAAAHGTMITSGDAVGSNVGTIQPLSGLNAWFGSGAPNGTLTSGRVIDMKLCVLFKDGTFKFHDDNTGTPIKFSFTVP